MIFVPHNLVGQDATEMEFGGGGTEKNRAPVIVDGNQLFYVRGISSFPAEERATLIAERIRKVAGNPAYSPDSVKLVRENDHFRMVAGQELILKLYQPDADIDGIDLSIFAEVAKEKTKLAIKHYREERSGPVLLRKSFYAIGAAALLVVLMFAMIWLLRRINIALQRKISSHIDSLEDKSFKLLRSSQLWKAIQITFTTLRVILIVILVAAFLEYLLSLFPWTSRTAKYVLDLLIDPLLTIGKGFLNFLPNLGFLLVLYFITRYILKLIRLFFAGLGEGGITIKDFHPEWAIPTFKIMRAFIIVFAVVIAYPYIPGSDTSAFKGISVFVGILFSLGSSSFIGNVIAGYSMTYRRAFRKGDRIQMGDLVGFVEEQKLLVTRLRSVKNEEIIIPNSILLNSSITNYSTRIKDPGLIIHTTVGIGYETPWRQVDAMLKEAACRTEGLLKEPPPFVLKKSLGDFSVNYEINAYCTDISRMLHLYNTLHQNILDVFNENNVQIMTPAYEGDPEIPKVVPPDQWHTPLAGEKQAAG